MRRIKKSEKWARAVFLHLALAVGSFVFSIPFIWLISTSCKVPDEMYPPRWVPQIPMGIVESPYIKMRGNEVATRPTLVKSADWDRLVGAVEGGITDQIVSMKEDLPELYWPYLRERDLARGVFARILKRAPDELFEKNEAVAAGWFAQNVKQEQVREVFEAVYRRVALSEVAIHGWDVSVEYPTKGGSFPWEIIDGDVKMIDRLEGEGLRRPGKELHYSFENSSEFTAQIVVPLEMTPENLKKVVVSLHGDRSWHAVIATLEMAGKRYVSAQKGFLESDRWQDLTWQMKSADDDSIKMKTWLRVDEAGTSEFNEPGKLRISVRVVRAQRPVAILNKYASNYSEVLRIVPLSRYVANSVFLVVMNILGQIIGSSLVAFSFARLRWPARDFCFMLVLATMMIPPQVTMIPVFLIFKNLGWYNTLRPLWVVSFFGSAFYIFLLRQFMRSIPADLEDSAKIDGCGYLGIYWRIIMPLVKPALATIGIFTFMAVWNDFMGPLIYVTDQRLYPLSLGLFALKIFKVGDFGLLMAASVLMTLPVILLFFAAQRQFIQGITLTGMKG
jgi:multiple sugar transport system permease protein